MSSVVATVRPAYRPYQARVVGVEMLSAHFVRISFSGPDFADFGRAGLDQRIKLILPFADGRLSDFGQDDPAAIAEGSWYARWRALPDAERNPLRTYTVRRFDPERAVLDVDFVVHHDPGPGGAWAAAARPGDEIVIIGPDENSPDSRGGIDWHPGTARRMLLAGDETAAPAICAILESLDETVEVDAFIEVASVRDVPAPVLPSRARLRWLDRADAPHGHALVAALTDWCASCPDVLAAASAPRPQVLGDIDVDREMLWDSPEEGEGEFYAWMAGESATVKTLRRLLVTGHGVDRKRVAFMGYWRLGQSERQE
ncbi:MAG: siderophore-interacting protein [Microbacterium sp.]|jgi:NADPH-dependent ferric siderophore reductase|nr:siderophore-interacting protein [Microbacterium sp.]